MKICPHCQSSYTDAFDHCPRDGKALVGTDAWTEGTVIRGKYRILGKLGQGGMGAVYKAQHVRFDEWRALKVMAPDLASDSSFVKRFMREAVITRKLQHPNAVRVEDIDEAEDGRPFIVMEYIEGRSLRKVMEEERPLPIGRTCAIIRQAAAALDAAHQLGMVHRDIKPDNIVLVETVQGEQAKVLDFGIAKLREDSSIEGGAVTMTKTGIIVGTPQYMSPEQAMGMRGDQLDGRSDLYSLGIVMYEMLAGQLPFRASTTMEMLMAHIQDPPAPILSAHPELPIPPGIASLTMRLLEKKRELRPASGMELIQELDRGQRGTPLRETRVLDRASLPASEPPPASRLASPLPPLQPIQNQSNPIPESAVAEPEFVAPLAEAPVAPAARITAKTESIPGTRWVAAIQSFYLSSLLLWPILGIMGVELAPAAIYMVSTRLGFIWVAFDFLYHIAGFLYYPWNSLVHLLVPLALLGLPTYRMWRGRRKTLEAFNNQFFFYYFADVCSAVFNGLAVTGYLAEEFFGWGIAAMAGLILMSAMLWLPWYQRKLVRRLLS